jgi:outer membrane protein TolC
MKKLLIILLVPFLANAQSAILENYIQEGLSSNLALKQQRFEIEKSLRAIEEAKSFFYPKIAFAPSYTLAAGGRQIDFPIGDLLNPVYGTLNKLTQSNEFPTLENQQIQFLPHNFHETKLTFQLPLFNSDIRYGIKLKTEMAKSEEAKKRLLEYELKYQIEAAYYQYLQSLEAINIYKESGVFLNEYLDFNQRLVENDAALNDVIFSSEYEINKLDGEKAIARKNSKVAAAYFNFLINREAEAIIEIDTIMLIASPLKTLTGLQSTALQRRPEFEQIKTGQQINNSLLLMQQKNAVLPSLFVGGNLGFQGFGYTFKDQGYALAQIGLNWDLYHGKEKKHKIEQTRIQQHILETKELEIQEQIKMQVAQAWFEFKGAEESLRAAEKALVSTQKLLSMVEKKYKNDSALYIEVLKAQNDHLVAGLTASIARFNLRMKKAALEKATGL